LPQFASASFRGLSPSLTSRWRKLSFLWKFQILFWIIFTVFTFPVTYVVARFLGRWEIGIFGWAGYTTIETSFMVLNTWLIGLALDSSFIKRSGIPRTVLFVILMSYISVLFQWNTVRPSILRPIRPFFGKVEPVSEQEFETKKNANVIYAFWLLCMWSTVYLLSREFTFAKERKRQLELVQAKQRQTEVLMLRSQINPHFLFNAMNSIVGEAAGNPKLDHIIAGLSDFLRYSLSTRSKNLVPFGEEFDATACYLEVEKTRLGGLLEVEYDIDPCSREIQVPGIILQPLMENAVKYGTLTSPSPLTLRIQTLCIADKLEITVANTGKWLSQDRPGRPSSGGVGITNVKEQLNLFYPDRHEFSIETPDNWVSIRVTIPVRQIPIIPVD
jgi:sensor histidine kinase YesM